MSSTSGPQDMSKPKLSRKEIQLLKDKKQQEEVALLKLTEAHHAVHPTQPAPATRHRPHPTIVPAAREGESRDGDRRNCGSRDRCSYARRNRGEKRDELRHCHQGALRSYSIQRKPQLGLLLAGGGLPHSGAVRARPPFPSVPLNPA